MLARMRVVRVKVRVESDCYPLNNASASTV
jgi:hypothetical protein